MIQSGGSAVGAPWSRARRGRSIAMGILAASLIPTVADAAVFKWTDTAGATTYGSEPPPGVKATRLDMNAGRLSIYGDGPIREEALPPRAKPAPDTARSTPIPIIAGPKPTRERDFDAIAVFEERRKRQLEEWRDLCKAERWNDCVDERLLTERYGRSLGWILPGPGAWEGARQ
mgnify:CR=1 FL=1